MPTGGRIVNISTGAANQVSLGNLGLKKRMLDPNITVNELDVLAKEYEVSNQLRCEV